MPTLSLPDGAARSFDAPVTGADFAAAVGPGLAKAALLVEVDGALRDLSRPIEQDASVRVITARDPAALEVIRHDTAHLLAEAVKELYPDVQVTIGPAIEDGFYYDFARDEPFTPADLEVIEARMAEIRARDEAVVREEWARDEAVALFEGMGEAYKAELIAAIPEGEPVTLYRQGGFVDLCRGPHLPSTGRVGAFKLLKVAGAYWRGDARNEMLQRIYGTAWADDKQLKAYLHRLEEAEKRDHRRLGREMGLFHFQEEAPGAAFWHPKGWALFRTLVDYMRTRQDRAGYREVSTPDMMDSVLWEASGHWQTFREHMFTSQTEDGRHYAIKPMNCPGHVQLYKRGIKSYRDLPLRISEFGKVHRYEPSGALHGLLRARAFSQDDAHIFCTPEQTQAECRGVTELCLDIYRDFGFEDVQIKFADRPPRRIGADAVWDQLEAALEGALESMGIDYSHNPGEGAFYGPKLEFVLRDAIGREWQCGTLQVDLNLPERLDATYVGEDGARHRPVMLHRALFGSLERFIGILLENYSGHLPLWLSPTHAVVATITDQCADYAAAVAARLQGAGLRIDADLRNEKIGYKVREHSAAKIPLILAVGAREAADGTVSVRRLGSRAQEIVALDEAVARICREAAGPLGGSAAQKDTGR